MTIPVKIFTFSRISENNLRGIHPDLSRVVYRALQLSTIDFRVLEGVRSEERQRQLVRNGSSKTLNSRHLTGHAVDLAPWIHNNIPWSEWRYFETVAEAMKSAAQELQVPLVWGGDWKMRDGPHFELTREAYPV